MNQETGKQLDYNTQNYYNDVTEQNSPSSYSYQSDPMKVPRKQAGDFLNLSSGSSFASNNECNYSAKYNDHERYSNQSLGICTEEYDDVSPYTLSPKVTVN